MGGSTFHCPTCEEDFYYEPPPQVTLQIQKDMGERDFHFAKQAPAVAIECPHCPAFLLLNLTTGEASSSLDRDKLTAQAAPGLVWDMMAAEDMKARVRELNERGDAAMKRGDVPTAKKTFEEAIKLRKHDPFSWYNLGVARYQSGDQPGSEAAFRHAVKFDKKLVNAWSNLGMVLLGAGQVDEASDCFDQGIQANPSYPKCYLGKGNVFMLKGDLKQARRYFEMALQKDPNYGAAREALRRLSLA